MRLAASESPGTIRTIPVPACPVCGGPGRLLHEGLIDRLFAAGGRWSLRSCSAPDCGTAWLDPRPVAEDLGKAYEDYYTHDEAAEPAGPLGWYRRLFLYLRRGYLAGRFGLGRSDCGVVTRLLGRLILLHPDRAASVDLTAFHLPMVGQGRFLEIGCGSGSHLALMRDIGWDVQGVDLDPRAVEAAVRRGLPARCGAVEDLDLPRGSFDAVGMCHVIEHVDDPDRLLRACRELLAPGGRLVLVTPNIRSFGHAHYGRHWLALDPPRHLRLYTCASLARMVRAAGYGEVTTSTSVRDAYKQFLGSRSISRTGRWTWGHSSNFAGRLGARLLQLRARCGLWTQAESGEEIVLLAGK